MNDREKVMQWLKICANGCKDGCPYEYKNLVYRVECKADLMSDALELLKAQEPKKRESMAMLPCKCGGKRREHWYGAESEALVCKRCGFKVVGKNSMDVIRRWNEAVKQ